MSRRWFNNFMAVCFVILFLTLLVLLGGCGTLGGGDGLKLEVNTPDKKVLLDVDYQIENGLRLVRTDEGEYDIELGSASTKDTESGLYILVSQMLQMMGAMAGFPIPAAPPTTNPDPD